MVAAEVVAGGAGELQGVMPETASLLQGFKTGGRGLHDGVGRHGFGKVAGEFGRFAHGMELFLVKLAGGGAVEEAVAVEHGLGGAEEVFGRELEAAGGAKGSQQGFGGESGLALAMAQELLEVGGGPRALAA